MKISNKLESMEAINHLNLNQFPVDLFKKGQDNELLDFIKKYPADYYAIRDKSKQGGVFKLKVKKQDIFNEVNNYDLFSINVSSYNYIENQVLVGEIQIIEENISLIASTKSHYSLRDAYNDPDFNFSTDIFDKTLNHVPYFDYLYKYIIDHNLQNVIVEFAIFNKPVGINNENIIIYELRTEY